MSFVLRGTPLENRANISWCSSVNRYRIGIEHLRPERDLASKSVLVSYRVVESFIFNLCTTQGWHILPPHFWDKLIPYFRFQKITILIYEIKNKTLKKETNLILILKIYLQKFNFILIFSSFIFKDNILRKIILYSVLYK